MPELDRQNLDEEFNLPDQEQEGPDEFEVEFEKENSTEQLLRDNIERANGILDQVEEEMGNGNFSARLVEVAGQILNTITNSIKEIQTKENNQAVLLLKARMVEMKRYELTLKEKTINKPTNQNLIIANREDVLKLIEENKKEKEEENEEN